MGTWLSDYLQKNETKERAIPTSSQVKSGGTWLSTYLSGIKKKEEELDDVDVSTNGIGQEPRRREDSAPTYSVSRDGRLESEEKNKNASSYTVDVSGNVVSTADLAPVQTVAGGNTVSGILFEGTTANSAPTGYYSKPDQSAMETQLMQYEGKLKNGDAQLNMTASLLRAQEAKVKEAQEKVACLEEEAERLYSVYQSSPSDSKYAAYQDAYRQYEEAWQVYQETLVPYEKLRTQYTGFASAYSTLYASYDSMLKQYNDEYSAWRGTIRSAEQISSDRATVNLMIESAERERAALNARIIPTDASTRGYDVPGMAEHNASLRAEIDKYDVLIDGYKKKLSLLEEEGEWSRYFSYTELSKADDFAVMSKANISKYGKDDVYRYINDKEAYYKAVSDGKLATVAEYISAIAYIKDDEIAVYNYLYATEGKKKAKEYLTFLDDTFTMRTADQIAKDSNGHVVDEVVIGGLSSLGTSVQNLTAGVANLLTGNEQPIKRTALYYADQKMAADNTGLLQAAHDTAAAIGGVAPSIAVGLLNPAAGALTMAAGAAGGKYDEMIGRGYSADEARLTGLGVGVLEGVGQYLIGGIGTLGGKGASKILSAIAPKAAAKITSVLTNVASKIPALARALGHAAIEMGKEGAEEALQTYFEPLVESWVTGEAYNAPDFEDVVYSALIGALTSGVLEGAPSIGKAAVDTVRNAGEKIQAKIGYTLTEYTEHQKKNWSDSKRIVVYESPQQFETFVQDAISGKIKHKKMYFGAISSDLAARIESDTGLNVENYNLSLGSDEILKVLKDHGKEETEAPRGQRAVIESDFAHIVDIVLNPTRIKLSDTTYNGKPAIIFTGEYNGRMNVTAVVSDKRLDLFVQTLFVNTKKENLSTPIGEQAPINTPEANSGTVFSDTIISENPEMSTGETKKQSVTEFLDDLKKTPEVYVQDAAQSHSVQSSISQSESTVKNESSTVSDTAGGVPWDIAPPIPENGDVALIDKIGAPIREDVAQAERDSESERRRQSFAADLSKYDARQRTVVQKAIDSGILNNTNRTHEFVDLIAKISADKGIWFDFTNNARLKASGFAIEGRTVNGYITKDGVTLNMDSAKAWQSTVGHEITHVLEGTEFYAQLQSALFAYAKAKGEYDSRLADITALYKDIKNADINAELTADLVGEYLFTDETFVKTLSAKHRNLFQKIYDEIKYLVKIATAGSKEARQLMRVKKAFEEAYRAEKNTADNSDVKYSIENLPDGKKYVRADRQVIFGNDPHSWGEQVEDYINGKIRRGENVQLLTDDGDVLTLTAETAGKAKHRYHPGGREMSEREYETKINAETHIDELAQISMRGNKNIPDREGRHGDFASGGWNYRTAYFMDFDGRYYRVRISVAIGTDGNVVYNVAGIEERSFPAIHGSSVKDGALSRKTSSEDSIPQSEANVKTTEAKKSLSADDIAPPIRGTALRDLRLEGAPIGDDIAPPIPVEGDVSLIEKYGAPIRADIAPLPTDKDVPPERDAGKISTVKERLAAKLQAVQTELGQNRLNRNAVLRDYDEKIAELQAVYDGKKDKKSKIANDILRRIERWKARRDSIDADYAKRISDLEERAAKLSEESRAGESTLEQAAMRGEVHKRIIDVVKARFEEAGFDFDKVLKKAKNLSTLATVDNTPQRVMEKSLGYKAGQILSDLTVNKVARDESEGIRWLNSFTNRKNGLLARLSKEYHIKPGSKKSAAAQMYAEGFFVDENDNIVQYGDAELAMDFPDAQDQADIKGLARDPRIRVIYDETLAAINESRARNAYPEIQRLDNYFLHFRAMQDTFSRLGLPFNPKDIRAKDLPTDLSGVTADLKPGQPYFASAMHRMGKRTSFDLLGGLERYLSAAKNQIYHIDNIQTLRALRNYIAEMYGQAHGLENLDALSDEDAEARIKEVYDAHLSTFAKFLNEEANVLAGKTALVDRGLEGIIGRRGIAFLDTVNRQVGANMVGFNVSSAGTNFLSVFQALAKTSKASFLKAFSQMAANKVRRIYGKSDGFAEASPVMIRRKGIERFYRTPWQKAGDAGYALMSAVDDVSTELIARAKYNELTARGMDAGEAHIETDKWVSRLMGDRSLGQQPQLYNSKMLGLFTKFQLEVRNQLDSQFYDTIQEAKASTEEIQNGLVRNAKKAVKIGWTFVQLAILQHAFGKAFEAVAGYNPAFDIVDVILKTFGLDDDEDDEDTVLDNIEEGFLALLEDLPYTSTFTGGRIPIESALPIQQFVTGKDDYGNEKSRLETLGEALPYYLIPGGYGQGKKTVQGLGMFLGDHPIAGSYTDSGKLRFSVEETPLNMAQAGLFGQYASGNARDYFDNERSPLTEKQIEEFMSTGMVIQDYWDYREGLSEYDTLAEKADYIDSLDVPVGTKNLLINNIADRKEPIDMTDYGNYSGFEEFDFASKNAKKYTFLTENGVSYAEYQGFDEDTKEAWTWAYKNPDGFTLSKAVADDVATYRKYVRAIDDIAADKDENGDSVSGSRKRKVIDYINTLDAEYGAKIILFKSVYTADDTYNYEIIDYLNGRDDISYSEMEAILKKLGFTVDSDGNISW